MVLTSIGTHRVVVQADVLMHVVTAMTIDYNRYGRQ